jgi:hypothetical protein
MDKIQASQGAHASALSTRNRQLFLARFFLLALFLALSVLNLQPKSSAQAETSAQAGDQVLRGVIASLPSHQSSDSAPNCQACQQAYVECLASGGGVICEIRYNDCIENCQYPSARQPAD